MTDRPTPMSSVPVPRSPTPPDPTPRQHYVAGLLFSVDRKVVALIRKNRPTWQAGKLNAIGGRIEPGETPHQAMVREFTEEAGRDVDAWSPVAVLTGPNFVVHFFTAFRDSVLTVRSMTDEEIGCYDARLILRPDREEILPNLRVIIALALDDSGIVKPVALTDSRPAGAA